MLNRRSFTALLGLGATTCLAGGSLGAAASPKKRIAFIGTVVFRHSHAQHFLDRLMLGYAWGNGWQEPRLEIASTHIAQFPEGTDLGRQRLERYGLKNYDSVRQALTLGGDQLAVDGVVVIGEHGKYPKNELGQTRYPRYEWFEEIVKVFEASGRSVPVFNDKHLSTEWHECQKMVADAKRLKFPFHAGSSLPVTRRMPAYELPWGADLRESVCVAYGGVDSYDFHALETAQCMSERRRGGEVGIRSVRALRDEKVWAYLAEPAQQRTRQLVVSALCRSHNLPVEDGYVTDKVTFEWARKTLPSIIGYFITHRDGFKTSVFMTGIRDFNYAGAIGDGDEMVSCQMYLPMPGHGSTTADFFNPLIHHLENMILENKQPYPIERTLLTSGMVIAAVQSLGKEGSLVETPEMAVEYSVPNESFFWRD